MIMPRRTERLALKRFWSMHAFLRYLEEAPQDQAFHATIRFAYSRWQERWTYLRTFVYCRDEDEGLRLIRA